MTDPNNKNNKWIDISIFCFSIIFIISLTNSIFINQIGYYGALISLLVKFYQEKKNPFQKTGLEVAFILFFIVEVLSTIFSLDVGEGIHQTLKKFLLIPTLYTFIAASKDFDRVKQFILIYIGSASITLIYYLSRSYHYFVNNLYQTQASGPSVFQYPITSSELMSFSVLILFAFLINEKDSIKQKILVLVLFLINLLALLATYKRTGWMGTAAGALLIIVLNRKWFMLIGVLIIFMLLVFLSRGESRVLTHGYDMQVLGPPQVFNTEGKASNILVDDDKLFVSDYDKGLLVLKDSIVTGKYEFPAPISDFKKVNENFYFATLADSRFFIMKKDDNDRFLVGQEFISPGSTMGYRSANDFLYVLDQDSGLTVFKDLSNILDTIRFKHREFLEQQSIFVDSNYCVLYSNEGRLTVFSMKYFLPYKIVLKEKLNQDHELIGLIDNKLIFNSAGGLKMYSFDAGKLNLLDINTYVGTILNISSSENRIISFNSKGELLEFESPLKDKLILLSKHNLGYLPTSISFNRNKIFTTFAKTNRLYSFVDPYYSTNHSRLAFWRAGLEIFKDYPLLGVGDIDLAELYKIYKRPFDKEIQGHLHSNYFHSLATLGAIGFTVVMFLLIQIFFIHLSIVKKLKNIPFAHSFSLGAIGGYVSFLVAGLTEYNLGDHEVITLVWFTLALSFAFSRNLKVEKSNG